MCHQGLNLRQEVTVKSQISCEDSTVHSTNCGD